MVYSLFVKLNPINEHGMNSRFSKNHLFISYPIPKWSGKQHVRSIAISTAEVNSFGEC